MGIEIQCHNESVIEGNTVEGVTFGISVSESERVVVSGNTIKNCSAFGIEAASNSVDISILGNTVNLTGNNAGSPPCIDVVSNSSRVTISGNVGIGSNSLTGNLVYVQSGPVVISNNIHRGALAYIHNASNIVISGNECDFTGGFAAIWLDATDADMGHVAVTGNRITAGGSVNCAFILHSPNEHKIEDVLITGNSFELDGAGGFYNNSFTTTNADTFILGIRSFGNKGSGDGSNYRSQPTLHKYWVGSGDSWTSGFWKYYNVEGGTIYYDATAGNGTIRLPNATGISGYEVTILKYDGTGNTVVISAYDTQTIDAASDYTLSLQRKFVTVRSNGSEWQIISSN
jgi:parallel beta-helix repeat protein